MSKERLNELSSRRNFIGMAGAGIASLAAPIAVPYSDNCGRSHFVLAR